MAVYNEYFGFRSAPFRLSPDPRFLFLSAPHREAMAGLLYAVREAKGFSVLTGEVGTGKTTLLHVLLTELGDRTRNAVIFNPSLTRDDLYQHLLAEFGLPPEPSILACTRALQRFLLQQFRERVRVVVVIDEAHGLATEALEEIRLLSNFETSQSKLLHVLLAGQPELKLRLEDRALRPLRQRISLRFELRSFDLADTAGYVRWRLARAGGSPDLFPPRTLAAVYRFSGGVPRLINTLCDNALVSGFAREQRSIGPDLIRRAARDLDLRPLARIPFWRHFLGRHRHRAAEAEASSAATALGLSLGEIGK